MKPCEFAEVLVLFYIIALSIFIILLDFRIREIIIIFGLLKILNKKL